MNEQAATPDRPIVAVYQNGAAVEGILQQAYTAPLIVDESRDSSRQDSHTSEASGGAQGESRGKVTGYGLGSIEAAIGADFRKRSESGATSIGRTTSTWQYTQAYYLHVVRNSLREQGMLSRLTGRGDAEALRPGDFVEFTCRFDPSQITALLDIITPDLVRAIARHVTHKRMMEKFTGRAPEEVRAYIERMDAEKTADGELAYAVAAAAGIDFRSTKTREFYGRIGADDDTVTAITMCDLPHFVIDDEDRLLDGQFSVLAKVTETLSEDVPILARNKVLSRLDAASVDVLLDKFNTDVLTDMQDKAAQTVEPHPADGQPMELDFDFVVDSRVVGACIKVMPIAIYV